MSRATPADVRAINGSTLSDPEIQVFIDVAHTLINATASCAGVDETQLTQAETYLTCHLMAGADSAGGSGLGAVNREQIEGMSSSYAYQTTNSIKSTNYGQMADMLMAGCLSQYEKPRAKVAFTGGA